MEGDQNLEESFFPFKQGGSYNSTKITELISEILVDYFDEMMKCDEMCLTLAKSFCKTKQYRALSTILIKILFRKNITNLFGTNTSPTEKPGNCKMCEKHLRKSVILSKDAGH